MEIITGSAHPAIKVSTFSLKPTVREKVKNEMIIATKQENIGDSWPPSQTVEIKKRPTKIKKGTK